MALIVGLAIVSFFLFVLIFVTLTYIRDLKSGKDSFLRKTGRWVRDVFDTLTELG